MLNLYLKCGMGENNQIGTQKSWDECMVKSFQDNFNVTLMKKERFDIFILSINQPLGCKCAQN